MPSHSITSSMEPLNGSDVENPLDASSQTPFVSSHRRRNNGQTSYRPSTNGRRHHRHREEVHPVHGTHRRAPATIETPLSRSSQSLPPREALQQPAIPRQPRLQPLNRRPPHQCVRSEFIQRPQIQQQQLSHPGQDYYLPHPPTYEAVAYDEQLVMDDDEVEAFPLPAGEYHAPAPNFDPAPAPRIGVAAYPTLVTRTWYDGHTPEERLRLGLPRWITAQQQGAYERAAEVYEYVDQTF